MRSFKGNVRKYCRFLFAKAFTHRQPWIFFQVVLRRGSAVKGKSSFDGTSVFEWIKLYICPEWNTAEKSNDFLRKRVECALVSILVSADDVFD